MAGARAGRERCERLRVLLIGSFGLGLKATLTARAAPIGRVMRRRGHDVRLLFVPWDCPAEAGRRFDLDGLPAVALRRSSRAQPLAFHAEHTLWLLHAVLRACLRHRPDVVHVFKPKAYGGAVALALAALSRLGLPAPRLVVDTDDWEGAGGWAELERRAAVPAPAWQRALASWQEPVTLRAAAAVTVASRALETLTWAQGVTPVRVHYLPNALEPAELARLAAVAARRQAVRQARPEPTLLLYSRLFEFAPARLAAVLARVRQGEPAARLVVVGEALRGEAGALRAELARAGVADMVAWAGWPGREAAFEHFAEAAVALVPFDDHLINRTRSSYKLLELMGAGLPIVAEAVGQNAICLEAGRSGRLAEPDDPAAFGDLVLELLRDPGAARRLGEGARQRVATAFTWEGQAAAVEAIYRQPGDRRPRWP